MTALPATLVYFLLGSFFVTVFSGQLIIAVYVVVASYLIWTSFSVPLFKKHLINPVALTWLLFCGWAAASVFWSVYPEESLLALLKIMVITLVGIAAITALLNKKPDGGLTLNNTIIFWINIAIALLVSVEHLSGYQIALFLRELSGFSERGFGQPMDKATILYTLILPFILLLFASNRKRLGILLAVLAAMYVIHPMFAATVAFFSAALIAWLYYLFGRGMITLLFAGMIAAVLLMPTIMSTLLPRVLGREELQVLPASWLHRLRIWQRSTEIISDNPLLGWGLNTADYIEDRVYTGAEKIMALHPHNIPLQLHLETGLAGSLLFSAVLLAMYLYLMTIQDRKTVAALLASFSAFSVFSLISVNAWHGWWLSTVFTVFIVASAFILVKDGIED